MDQTIYTVDYALKGSSQVEHKKDFANKREAWNFIKGLLATGNLHDLFVGGEIKYPYRRQTELFLSDDRKSIVHAFTSSVKIY